mmetsp:Transcript_21134/g.37435  ORF Transcript_21134/g.37435 Transcript_21134/m.37435 type:complete len:259 (+) Transcript_21134:173-949(+)
MDSGGDGLTGDYKAFLGGISWKTTEEGLFMYFESVAGKGKVIGTTIMRDRFTGQPRGFGFVTFSDEETLNEVCRLEQHQIDGKEVEVKPAIRKDAPPETTTVAGSAGGGQGNEGDRKNTPSTVADFQHPERKIFVGGLLPETKETDLADYFGKFGKLSSVVIKYDPDSNRSRGFGFVTFEDGPGIDRACEAGRHHTLHGKRVEIKRYQKTSGPSTAPESDLTERLQQPPKLYSNRSFADVYDEYFLGGGRMQTPRNRA